MSQHYSVQPAQFRAGLVEASRSRTPATLTYQTANGWTMAKTRFLPDAAQPDVLCLELAAPLTSTDPMPEPGQEIGVSFRRGSRKCVFTSCLRECIGQAAPGGHSRRVMRLTWPESVQELQRRMYHRTPVPQGLCIPVELWLPKTPANANNSPPPRRGRMVDLSAGGLSVELTGETRPGWRENDQLACRFAGGSDRRPVEVTARVTNYEQTSDGLIRVGLQFMGLDTGERGRQALQQINQITHVLRQSCTSHR